MKNVLYCLLIGAILCCCTQEKDTTFLIAKDRVGKLERNSTVENLEEIYALDSVVKDTGRLKLGATTRAINIFEKGGKHLVSLRPNNDSVPTIENIRIYDPRFVTEEGVGINSTFKDIEDNYTIKKIITSMNNVVVFIKESDAYFTISKEELPASLRYAASTNIDAVQIPGKAKIKYLMVGWE